MKRLLRKLISVFKAKKSGVASPDLRTALFATVLNPDSRWSTPIASPPDPNCHLDFAVRTSRDL